jgi:uncharacterized membrane protein YhfC
MTPILISLAPAFGLGLAALLCICGPILIAGWWRRRTGAPIVAFFYGALIFIIFQLVLRLPWQIPLGVWARNHEALRVPFLVFSAFTAGVFEEVGRWVGYRTLLRRDRRIRTGVMYGLGHGGAEAILLVGLNLMGLLVIWILASVGQIDNPLLLDTIRAQTATLRFGTTQLAVVERASAMATQVGLSLIVLQVFVRGQWRWLAMAIAMHMGIDLAAVVLLRQLHFDPWLVESGIAVAGATILFLGARVSVTGSKSIRY